MTGLFASRLRQILLAVAVISLPLAGQNPTPASAPPCSSPEHHQFDFWLGDWEVKVSGGMVAGTNSITREIGGCVLHEHWQASRGGPGESFNIYDASRKVWHQTWVDASGSLLVMEGGLEGSAMVMRSERVTAAGKKQSVRMTWTPLPDGAVRQLWEGSADGGATWSTQFDGMYRRKTS